MPVVTHRYFNIAPKSSFLKMVGKTIFKPIQTFGTYFLFP
ncbi:hypothetical protein DBT_2209 [Dissulfuribacter thermophilus]|uniref:Uncharacterized protein n=1 Tax=Dissulfuribacter thermophilus TaxID=1156395 RepID=A0A1B9F327_9BACT|nr:hypothetical protein DBT_2209 [Dissulfuribacter thermophilus]